MELYDFRLKKQMKKNLEVKPKFKWGDCYEKETKKKRTY